MKDKFNKQSVTLQIGCGEPEEHVTTLELHDKSYPSRYVSIDLNKKEVCELIKALDYYTDG